MDYEMEALLPIVGKLAEKYTAGESTSVPYEKAEQFMGAVLYCIQESVQFHQNSMISKEGLSVQAAYESGKMYVEEKTKKALTLYHKILPGFRYFENQCLYDTFVKGLPEFFKWYDVLFYPQNEIVSLDYPVLKDISDDRGVDKVYEFLKCIELEQMFLERFPTAYVIKILSRYDDQYREMMGNICEIVFTSVVGHMLTGIPLSDVAFQEGDYQKIQDIFVHSELCEIERSVRQTVKAFVLEYYGDCGDLETYLEGAIHGILIRMDHAARDTGIDCSKDKSYEIPLKYHALHALF